MKIMLLMYTRVTRFVCMRIYPCKIDINGANSSQRQGSGVRAFIPDVCINSLIAGSMYTLNTTRGHRALHVETRRQDMCVPTFGCGCFCWLCVVRLSCSCNRESTTVVAVVSEAACGNMCAVVRANARARVHMRVGYYSHAQ